MIWTVRNFVQESYRHNSTDLIKKWSLYQLVSQVVVATNPQELDALDHKHRLRRYNLEKRAQATRCNHYLGLVVPQCTISFGSRFHPSRRRAPRLARSTLICFVNEMTSISPSAEIRPSVCGGGIRKNALEAVVSSPYAALRIPARASVRSLLAQRTSAVK